VIVISVIFEYDRRVAELGVDSDVVTQYFFENPEKRETRIHELNTLRDEIVFSNVRKDHKEKFLSEINRSLARLRPATPENQYNPYMLVGLGILIGILVKTGFDYASNKFIEMRNRAYQKGQQKGMEEYFEDRQYK